MGTVVEEGEVLMCEKFASYHNVSTHRQPILMNTLFLCLVLQFTVRSQQPYTEKRWLPS